MKAGQKNSRIISKSYLLKGQQNKNISMLGAPFYRSTLPCHQILHYPKRRHLESGRPLFHCHSYVGNKVKMRSNILKQPFLIYISLKTKTETPV